MAKKKKFFTIANFLTLIRLLSAPLLAYLIITENLILAGILFVGIALSELDGTIARRMGQDTLFGANFDSIADTTMFAGGLIGIAVTGVLHYYYLILFFFLEIFYYLGAYMMIIKKKARSLHPETQIDKIGGAIAFLTIIWGTFEIPYFNAPLWVAIVYNCGTIGKRVWTGFSD